MRRVRSILHDIESRGISSAQLKFAEETRSIKSLKRSLRGRLDWISNTKGRSDPVFRHLANRFNIIFPDCQLEIGPDLTKIKTMTTWIIESIDTDTKHVMSQGTAFFVKGIGLVTAAHCLKRNCEYIIFSVEDTVKNHKVSLKKYHEHIDLAILEHDLTAGSFLELELSTREPNVGEELWCWGFPNYGPGKDIEIKSGKLASKPTVSAVKMLSLDFKIYPGMSGGPILNTKGEVVGVVHKGGNEESHDLAVHIKHLREIWA